MENNMNKNILLVMKWLKNPESVSQEELYANRKSADAAAAYWAAAAYAYAAADRAAYWAAANAAFSDAAANADYYADAAADAADATYWIDEYFKYTSEDKQIYIDKLGE
jgi:hypothetical protein